MYQRQEVETMTNYEKFKDELIKILSNNVICGLAIQNGKPAICDGIPCSECDFEGQNSRSGTCAQKLKDWLNAEYIEPPKLTKAERAFVESLHSDVCISRHPNMECIRLWRGSAQLYVRLVVDFYNINFPFIDSETKWSVEDLLKLEVQDD
jgi:hypothetical protein